MKRVLSVTATDNWGINYRFTVKVNSHHSGVTRDEVEGRCDDVLDDLYKLLMMRCRVADIKIVK